MPKKKWGKADKAALSRLIEDGDVDINDTSTTNINRVVAAQFFSRCFFRRGEGIQQGEEEKRRK